MPLRYSLPPSEGAIRQGEILASVMEYRVLGPGTPENPENAPIAARLHPWIIVLTADCDLDWDFKARFVKSSEGDGYTPIAVDESDHKLLPYILCCSLFEEINVRSRPTVNSDIWKRIRSNQDERYHYLSPDSSIGGPSAIIPISVLDFKKVVCLPPELLYSCLFNSTAERKALIPDVYIHDIMHRFYGYLSRVALPD